MSQANAEKFLEELDKDPHLRDEIRKMSIMSDLAVAHKLSPFSGDDLEKALTAKWGTPEKRKGHQNPFTCCCG